MKFKFETGKTYAARSLADYDHVFQATISQRSEKTVVLSTGKRCKVYVMDGCEYIMPLGRYSMAPCIYANKEKGVVAFFDQVLKTI